MNKRTIFLMLALLPLSCSILDAGHQKSLSNKQLRNKLNASAKPKQKISSREINGFIITTVQDPVTHKMLSSKVTRPDGTSRVTQYDLVSNERFDIEIDAHGRQVDSVKTSGLDLNFDKKIRNILLDQAEQKSVVTVQTDMNIDTIMKNKIQDSSVIKSVEASQEYNNFKSSMMDKFKDNVAGGISFLSHISWSKLLSYQKDGKMISNYITFIDNFFKDLSIQVKQYVINKPLSAEDQHFVTRESRMKIQQLNKKINTIEQNIALQKLDLQNTQKNFEIEQAKNPQNTRLIAQYKKDILYLQQSINLKKTQQNSLKTQQSDLMQDKFDTTGHLIL